MSSDDIYSFYVYVYLDPRTREPFYVGKGKGNRAYAHISDSARQKSKLPKHNKLRQLRIMGLSPIVVFPYQNLSESEAFMVESSLIAHYGRRDTGTGCLCNLSNGGEGNTGHRYCEDKTPYKMTHIYSGEVVYKTRLEMREELRISRQCVCDLFKGRKTHTSEWYLGDIPVDFLPRSPNPNENHAFINIATLTTVRSSIADAPEIVGITKKEATNLVVGRRSRVREWAYRTLDGKDFKRHGETYTIVNVYTNEIFSGTQTEIQRKINDKNTNRLLGGGCCIKGWIEGDSITEEDEIRHNKNRKFQLKNKTTGETRMMSVTDLQRLGAKSHAFGVMRRLKTFKGWYRT